MHLANYLAYNHNLMNTDSMNNCIWVLSLSSRDRCKNVAQGR